MKLIGPLSRDRSNRVNLTLLLEVSSTEGNPETLYFIFASAEMIQLLIAGKNSVKTTLRCELQKEKYT